MNRAANAAAPLNEVLDVSDEHATAIKKCCSEAFESQPTGASVYGDLSKKIRADVERATGQTGWNVVVGRSFGAGVTHAHQHYVHLSPVHGVNVLVWRS